MADVLIARIKGGSAPAPFAGEVICYVEMGDDSIGKVNVNFLSGPAPTAVFIVDAISAGATEHTPVSDVGDGIVTATVRTPPGAILGLIHKPHFSLP